MWGSTTEEDMRGYAATTLPFQSFGALGMARTEFDDDSASSQFFWLLFDSDLTPAGKNLLDGAYACFGYTVEGADGRSTNQMHMARIMCALSDYCA